MLKKNKAFTLVELIVVITILAILWTIAFISLTSYSETARDSTRISDLSTMKTTLELFHLEAWKYPNTTDEFNVFYSWTVVWTQWTFWKTTINNVDRLGNIPTDPLTDKKYTYSLTNTKQEYQLSWLIEWDTIAFNNSLMNNANAWDIKATAIVTWNYNWVLFKTLTWSNCEVLAIPSIISSLPSNITTDLISIIASGWLVYNWYNNLPTEYTDSKYDSTWWFNFNPTSVVVYSDNLSCQPLFDSENIWARSTLIQWIQTAYSWTIISNEPNIATIINIDINNANVVASLWTSIVNNSLGGTLDFSISGSVSTCIFWSSVFWGCIF